MSHTQGKLSIDRFGNIKTPDSDDLRVSGATLTRKPEAEANTRRLVACWNLLLPFTTEEIEAGIDLEKLVRENAVLKEEAERFKAKWKYNRDDYVEILEESKAELKSENEKLREAIQNFLDTCEATNPLINGPTFVAIDALHAVMEGK